MILSIIMIYASLVIGIYIMKGAPAIAQSLFLFIFGVLLLLGNGNPAFAITYVGALGFVFEQLSLWRRYQQRQSVRFADKMLKIWGGHER